VLGEEHPHTADSYNNVAGNLNAQGKYAEAEVGHRKALAIRRKVLGEKHPDTAQSYDNVAGNLHAQGKYAEAEAGHRKALAIRRKVLGEEHPDTALSYNNVAGNLDDQGKHAEAEAGYRKALAIRRKVLGEEHPHTAASYNNMAGNLNVQGKYAEAEAGLGKALAICRKVLGEEHPHTAHSYNNVAGNLNAQGKYAEAEVGFGKALAIRRKVLGEEHPHTADSYNNVACNLEFQGKHAEAEAGYGKALAIRRKVLGEEHPDTALSYNNVASSLHARGKDAEAEAGHRKALAIRRTVLGEEHPDTAQSYNNLASSLHAQGKYAKAEALLQHGAEVYFKARGRVAGTGLTRGAFANKHSRLVWLASTLVRNDKPDLAWQRLEEHLGRGTWDDLSARLRRPAVEQARQIKLSNQLDRLDQQLERIIAAKEPTPEQEQQRKDLLTRRRQAQDELDSLTAELEKKYGPTAGQVFPRQEIQQALAPDTALIAWIDVRPAGPKAADPNGEHWAVLLRATGGPIFERMSGSGPNGLWTDGDWELPAKLRDILQSSHGDWQPLARRLREQRLGPLAKHLDGVKKLVVLPSGALAGVPVEVFADGYTVSYALSGTMYAHLRKQPKVTTQGLLALADPVFEPTTVATTRGEGDKYAALPGTRVEVEALRRLFAAEAGSHVLLDSQASEQRLYQLAREGKLAAYRYLHFATHGDVDNRFPLRSALVLSRDALPDPFKQLDAGLPVYDGRLTAEEILRQWNLKSELVTLSACQTALGKYERGEGFVGFAQALILSGSRSVCLSLWEVNDTATALLMERFYQNMLGKRAGLDAPMGKAAALAEAKAWLRTLPRAEARARAAMVSKGVARGKGRPVSEVLPRLPEPPAAARDTSPYAHPYYWAAFVLIGDPE
jgi:CHAT domain-containing protein/Flp pilus assembly protein TadD